MPNQDTCPITVPQVTFSGTGITVDGKYIDGEIMLAWFRFSADRGYVLKFDHASTEAFVRTDEDARIMAGGMFDTVRSLISIASGASL